MPKRKIENTINSLLANEISEVSFYTLIKDIHGNKIFDPEKRLKEFCKSDMNSKYIFDPKSIMDHNLWFEISYWNNFKIDQNRDSARDYKF